MVPASLSLLLAAVPTPARPRAIGTWAAVGALGAALGPVIGGALVQVNWRWVFWINLPVGLAATVLALRMVPESKDEQARGRPDVIGAVLLAASVGLIAYALVEAPTWGWGSEGSWACWPPRWPAARPWCGARTGGRRRSSSRSAPAPDIQRRVRRVDPVLRGLRRVRAQLGGVPHRRLALLRGRGRAGHRARPADGAAVRPCRRAPAGRLGGRPRPGRGVRLRGERGRPGALAEPNPGPPGLPDPPAARPAARRRRGRAEHPDAAGRGQRVAHPGRSAPAAASSTWPARSAPCSASPA